MFINESLSTIILFAEIFEYIDEFIVLFGQGFVWDAVVPQFQHAILSYVGAFLFRFLDDFLKCGFPRTYRIWILDLQDVVEDRTQETGLYLHCFGG